MQHANLDMNNAHILTVSRSWCSAAFALLLLYHYVDNFSRLEATPIGLDESGRPVLDGQVTSLCLHYEQLNWTFSLTCSFNWTDHFMKDDFILLNRDEIFDGKGHSIDLSNIREWKGLFMIEDSQESGNAPTSLEDAPVIRSLHMLAGQTSVSGGFIVRQRQKNFIVESCSSSGIILGGGICGDRCSGYVRITNCHSTGDIVGGWSGGIAGGQIAYIHGQAIISQCFSTGEIGGIWTFGICGNAAGYNRGAVKISQCYTMGEISGLGSGGIAARGGGYRHGHVTIADSYARGNITGSGHPGGICGQQSARNNGTLVCKNVYSSGYVLSPSGGGIIGQIEHDAYHIHIERSVYNAMGNESLITGDDNGLQYKAIRNSANLQEIENKIYCFGRTDCWDTRQIWTIALSDRFPVLQFQGHPAMSPTPSPFPSPKRQRMEVPVQYPLRSVIIEEID